MSEEKTKKSTKKSIKKTTKKPKTTKVKKTTVKKSKKIDALQENKTFKNAEKLYKNKNYEEAYHEYISLFKEFPKNKKIYKRLIECITQDYTFKDSSKDFKNAFNDYVTTYKILATNREITLLEKKLDEYKNVKPQGRSKFLLIALTGYFGVHKFIEKKYILGVIYLLTFGLFGIGVIYDLVVDYAEYENDTYLDIVRYIISTFAIIFALLKYDTINFYYIIIAAIIFMPIVFSKLLQMIPKIIKLIVILILIYLGFKTTTAIEYVPTNLLGTWQTTNENTNFESLTIKPTKTTVKFNDRDKQTGLNEYDNDTKILKIYMNATTFYRFKLDSKNKVLCIYNESETCYISFEKKKK